MISELLSKGVENAICSRDIGILLALKPRQVTRLIERERREGKPICAVSHGSNRGYYLAENKKDMENYCRRLEHRTERIEATRKACYNSIKNLP